MNISSIFSRNRFGKSVMIRAVSACALILIFDIVFVPNSLLLPAIKLHIAFLAVATLISFACRYVRPDRKEKVFGWFIKAFGDAGKQQRLYLCVICLWCIAFMAWVTGAESLLNEFWVATSIFMFAVAVRDVVEWYEELLTRSLGKALLGLGFAASSTLAYGLASQHIAQVIHVTPTNFTKSILLIAILEIPLLIAIAAFLGATLLLMVSSLIMMTSVVPGVRAIVNLFLKEQPVNSSMRFAVATRFFRITLLILVGHMLFSVLRQGSGAYEQFIYARARDVVFGLDMYEGTECKLEPGFKLAPLGDSQFLLARRDTLGDVSFLSPQKCGD